MSIDPLSEALGEIKAQLSMVLRTQSEDREASARYRTDIRRDLSEVKDMAVDLKNRVNNTADEVAELRPLVESHQIKFVQGEGAWNAAKALWIILIGLGATGIGAIVHAIWPKH